MSTVEGMVVCVHLPRFELRVAAGGSAALAAEPLAIAPAPGGKLRVGEVSGRAEACGVRPGMELGEALARCPKLVLLPGDPVGVAAAWEGVARAVEGIGAEVELAGPGLLYFDAAALWRIYGDVHGVIAVVRRALGRSARIGAAPRRFSALAAALEARSSRALVVEARGARRYLARQPVELLCRREETAALVGQLERLGLRTLGEVAAIGQDALADRFGVPGLLALRLALAFDEPLRTRRIAARLAESMELAQSNSAEALERTLEVLIDRLLARPERQGRMIRAVVLSARLVERGTWSELVVFRQALCDRLRMRLALAVRLRLLPAPAETLTLAVQAFGTATGEQGTLLDGERSARLARLQNAVGQIRTLAGANAALRAMPLEPRSRVPERRFAFTPYSR